MKTMKGNSKKFSVSDKAAPTPHDESLQIRESKTAENSSPDFAVAEKDEVKNAEEKMRQQIKRKKL